MVTKDVDGFGDIRYFNEQGQLHREDGPAEEYFNGDKAWVFNGKLHRIDGPAIEYPNGNKSYFIMHKHLSYKNWLAIKDYPLLWS